MYDRQPQTAWLDTPHSGEATKTETESRGLEERDEGAGFSGERSQGEKKKMCEEKVREMAKTLREKQIE